MQFMDTCKARPGYFEKELQNYLKSYYEHHKDNLKLAKWLGMTNLQYIRLVLNTPTPEVLKKELDNHIYTIKVGDIYECCSYHAILCTEIDYEKDHIAGISLVDGSYPRSCSLHHCGVFKLDINKVWKRKQDGLYSLPFDHNKIVNRID